MQYRMFYSKLLQYVIFFLFLRFYLDLRSVLDCRQGQNRVSRIERQPSTTFPTEPTVFADSHAACVYCTQKSKHLNSPSIQSNGCITYKNKNINSNYAAALNSNLAHLSCSFLSRCSHSSLATLVLPLYTYVLYSPRIHSPKVYSSC